MKVKVIFLQPGITFGYAYFQEQTAILSPEQTDELLRKKVVAKCPETFTPLPQNFPYRSQVLSSGIFSVELLEQCGDVVEININQRDKVTVADLNKQYKTKEFLNNL